MTNNSISLCFEMDYHFISKKSNIPHIERNKIGIISRITEGTRTQLLNV